MIETLELPIEQNFACSDENFKIQLSFLDVSDLHLLHHGFLVDTTDKSDKNIDQNGSSEQLLDYPKDPNEKYNRFFV